MKCERLGGETGRRRQLAISGLERVLGECCEQVGEQQFLMLLFVVDAEFDQCQRIGLENEGSARSSSFVDRGAIIRTSSSDGRLIIPRLERSSRAPSPS